MREGDRVRVIHPGAPDHGREGVILTADKGAYAVQLDEETFPRFYLARDLQPVKEDERP